MTTEAPAALAPTTPSGGLRPALVLLAFAAAVIGIAGAAQYRYADEFSLLAAEAPWLTLATAVAVWAARPGAGAVLDWIAAPLSRLGSRRTIWLLGAASLVGLLLTARFVLDRFPNSGDEYAYVLQAETYARGRLWVSPPPLEAFFHSERFFAKNGIWVSPYQPGWPVVMTPFAVLGLPLWAVAPVVGAAMVVAFFVLARSIMSDRAAWFATLALVTSPFFVLNLSSYFSHGVGAFAAVGLAVFIVRYLKTGEAWAAVLAGACVGFVGFVRAYNAVFFILPVAATLLITPGRRIGLIWLGIGGAPLLAALLGYNAAITGNPLLPVPEWFRRGVEPIGRPGAAATLESVRRLIRLYFWTSPVFALAWPAALAWLGFKRRLHLVDWFLPCLIVGYALYAGTAGNQYGPRYLFEAWPFALLTVLRAAEPVLSGQAGPRRAAWAAAALLVHLTFQASYSIPRFSREHDVIVERQDLYRLAERAHLNNAVVIVAGPVGRLRPMWLMDTSRNGLELTGKPVIYARDLDGRNVALRAYFKGRRFLTYRDGRLTDAP